MKDELMNVKIKFTEQSQLVAELKQEICRLETKVKLFAKLTLLHSLAQIFFPEFRDISRRKTSQQ